MPRLSMEEIAQVVPRWPDNEYGVQAPAGICGDYQCRCAREARRILTDGEYELAFGVPKDFGLDTDDDGPSTAVTMDEVW
jgi:hypothetical protein